MNQYHENLTLWHYDTCLGDLQCKTIEDDYPHYVFIPNVDFFDHSNSYYSTLKKILFTNNPIPDLVREHFKRGFQILQKGNKRAMHMSLPMRFRQNKYQFFVNRNFATYEGGMITEIFHFFYRTNNCFSQWYKSEFEYGGVKFSSAEQFMMYRKAELFNDHDAAKKILKANNPREQKAIGRTVRNFDEAIWKKRSIEVVYEGNKAKFTQDPILLEKLMKTEGRTLVEASPTDIIWGVGLAEEDERIQKRNTWQGDNLLGIVLTELREELRGNSNYDDYGLGYFSGKEFKEKYSFYIY